MTRIAAVIATCALAACSADAPERATPPAAAPDTVPPAAATPIGVVDSIHSPEESLRRFREGVPAVTSLAGGAASRDELVRRFVRAVERRDTAELRALAVTRAEFAYLLFPESRFARPPMRMDPALVWFQMQVNGEKGIGRVLQRFGGADAGFLGYACEERPRVEGAARIWEDCSIRREDDERGEHTVRWFGSVVERDGRFKMMSYANAL